MKRIFFLLLSVGVLSGCQTAVRPYDGVLGYKVTAKAEGQVSISYIDEDRRSWADIKKRVSEACAYELKNPADHVNVVVLAQEQFSQQVDMAFSMPMGPIASGDQKSGSGSGLGSSMMTSSANEMQSVLKDMKLKRLLVQCTGS